MVAGGLLLAAVGFFLFQQGWLLTNEAGAWRATPGTTFVRGFAPLAAGVMVFLLVFGLLGGWLLAGRMLAPLDRITHATRAAANGSLSHRIRLPGHEDEFRELADAFDTMLARLEAHVAEQRRFAANASHELRTPLAVSKSLLDVARADPDRDIAEVLDRLSTVNTRAIDLTEALLLLSRAEQRAFTHEDVDLSLLAEEATETLLPLAERRGVTVETDGVIARTSGSGALLLQLTTNLVHNAIVHNLPEHGTVRVTTGVTPGRAATLTVENTGEVVAPDLLATLTEPFQRGTERIRADHAGVGLGLAIVQSITRAHDGTLALDARPGGGLRITVELPATAV
ncbi:sensor histidine kinase [Streptomyces sp. BYX5S]